MEFSYSGIGDLQCVTLLAAICPAGTLGRTTMGVARRSPTVPLFPRSVDMVGSASCSTGLVCHLVWYVYIDESTDGWVTENRVFIRLSRVYSVIIHASFT